MLRDGTVARVTNEICWALASNLGPNINCHFLEKAIERAVWLCMLDSPHCQQMENAERRLACRIRQDVESILESYQMDRPFLERVAFDIEQAVHAGLGGSAVPGAPSGSANQ